MAKRKNRQVAIMAVARKLVTIAYLMLKNNEPYRYAKPELMAHKFAVLNRGTNGSAPRRKRGFTAQARSGLTAVYTHAGLPPVVAPDELPNGERRMLMERKLNDFVSELYTPAASHSRKSKQTSSPVPQKKRGAAKAPPKS